MSCLQFVHQIFQLALPVHTMRSELDNIHEKCGLISMACFL